jgi:mycoredoxin
VTLTSAGMMPIPLFEDPMSSELVMYTTTWCGYCVRLKRFLDAQDIPYREVNIEDDEAAALHVMQANGGNRTVPTVDFPSGVTISNPSPNQVLEALRDSA